MIRRLTSQMAEFDPAISVSVVFSNSSEYVFQNVIKAQRLENGTLILELTDQSFAEIQPHYLFYQVGIND